MRPMRSTQQDHCSCQGQVDQQGQGSGWPMNPPMNRPMRPMRPTRPVQLTRPSLWPKKSGPIENIWFPCRDSHNSVYRFIFCHSYPDHDSTSTTTKTRLYTARSQVALSSLSLGWPAEPPSHGALASHGPMLHVLGLGCVCWHHGWFLVWGIEWRSA